MGALALFRRPRREVVAPATQAVLGVVVVAFLVAAPSLLKPYLVGLLAIVMIFGLFAMSVNLLAGLAGLISLGHAGIMAVAAYGVAYVAQEGGAFGVQVATGVAAGVLVSTLFGVMAMRTGEIYFIMITLAQGMIVWGVAWSLSTVTGGENGIRGVYRPSFLAAYWHYYYLCLAVFLLAFALVWLISRSPVGLSLRGIRDSSTRMVALGYNPALYKLYAFVLSGILATAAGVLYVYYYEFISPASAAFLSSAQGVLMVILGGVGTLSGPLVGAGIVVWIENIVSVYLDRWPTVMGLTFIVVILFARDGLVGGMSRLWRRFVVPVAGGDDAGPPAARVNTELAAVARGSAPAERRSAPAEVEGLVTPEKRENHVES